MIDIHCHLLPGLDDGPATLDQAIAMARMAVADGTQTLIATPHQLGQHRQNTAHLIRARTDELQACLKANQIPLTVYPGGDVRIEADLIDQLQRGEVMTLADRGRHVLLELPHELYFPLEPVLDRLHEVGLCGILSHPERNLGLLHDPACLPLLVEHGCLMQITASSLLGGFGAQSQRLAESMLQQGLVHFVASDGHGTERRRPRLRAAYRRVVELTNCETALNVCGRFPERICQGASVPVQPAGRRREPRRWFAARRQSGSFAVE